MQQGQGLLIWRRSEQGRSEREGRLLSESRGRPSSGGTGGFGGRIPLTSFCTQTLLFCGFNCKLGVKTRFAQCPLHGGSGVPGSCGLCTVRDGHLSGVCLHTCAEGWGLGVQERARTWEAESVSQATWSLDLAEPKAELPLSLPVFLRRGNPRTRAFPTLQQKGNVFLRVPGREARSHADLVFCHC